MRIPNAQAAGLILAIGLSALVAGTASAQAASPSAPAIAGQTVYPMTITQPDGTTAVIPAPPTRIVTVDNPATSVEFLVALGVQPIGGLIYPGTSDPATTHGLYKDIQLDSFKQLGTAPSSPDLEAIAAEHPDLIVGEQGNETADLSQLEAIAPVASIRYGIAGAGQTGIAAQPWYAELELLGKVLNRQAQANAFVASYEAAAAKARPELAGKTVTFLVLSANSQTYAAFGPTDYVGPILTYIGLTVPPLPTVGTFSLKGFSQTGEEEYSVEQTGAFTADYLLVGSNVASTGVPTYQAFISNAVVQQVPAVMAGRAISNAYPVSYFDFPTEGPIALLNDIPLITKVFETTGQPIYHPIGQVGANGRLSSVNYGGYNGPLYYQSGAGYSHIENPSNQLAPQTTVYGI